MKVGVTLYHSWAAVFRLQVNLAQNLTAAFWKYSGMADGEDGDEDADDMGEWHMTGTGGMTSWLDRLC